MSGNHLLSDHPPIMLDLLNRAFLSRIFSDEYPDILLSFLNHVFFETDKVVQLHGTSHLVTPCIHVNSCYQDPIICKVETETGLTWIVELDVLRIHPGRNTSFVKLEDHYFDGFMKSTHTYMFGLPFLYIGICTFDIGKLKETWSFSETHKNKDIHLRFLNLETWQRADRAILSPLDQWMYAFKDSSSFLNLPAQITEEQLIKAIEFPETKEWDAIDIGSYQRNVDEWEDRNARILRLYREVGSVLLDEYLNHPATKVQMSLVPIQNQLLYREPRKISLDSLSEGDLQGFAFQAFRTWSKNAKAEYPAYDFYLKDERVIVSDFRSALKQGLDSLFSSDRFYSRFPKGWDIGYVLGYIEGNLMVGWRSEYIQKQSNDYKMLMALKVLRDYLPFNDTAKIHLKTLYKDFVESDVNLTEPNLLIQPESLVFQGETLSGKKFEEEEALLIALDNLANAQVLKMAKDANAKEIRLSLSSIISSSVIRQLIDTNMRLIG